MADSRVVKGYIKAGSLIRFAPGSGLVVTARPFNPADQIVAILPITEDGVGPVEKWMAEYLKCPGDYDYPDWLIEEWDKLDIEGSVQEWADEQICAALTEILNGGKDHG